MDSDVFYFTILALIAIWICKKFLTTEGELKTLGVAHEKPLPIIGNALPIILQKENFVEIGDRLYKKFSEEQIHGFYTLFGDYTLVVTDPELIKQITIKDFDYFVNRDRVDPDIIDKYLGKSLLMVRDQKWKEMRANLSPIFTTSKMKSMFKLLQECADDFVAFHESKAQENQGENTIDSHDVFARVTADGIATTVLGFEGDCVRNEKSEIFKIAQDIEQDFANPRTLTFVNVFPSLYKLLGVQIFRKSIHRFFETNILDEIRRRRELKIYRQDIIQLLMQAQDGNLKADDEEDEQSFLKMKVQKLSKWSDEDLTAQGLLFFLGGFETTAVLMQACFWELAMNETVQQTLVDEVDGTLENLDGKSISYEELNGLKYLDMVINETLRKWPSFRLTSRLCSKDYVLNLRNGKTCLIKKGVELFLPFGSIQMNSKYFPDPEVFDPLRFSDDNKKKIQSGTFMPFGMGPRICIGSRYALLEAKLLLFSTIAKFRIEKCERTPEKLIFSNGTAGFGEKIFVSLKLRK